MASSVESPSSVYEKEPTRIRINPGSDSSTLTVEKLLELWEEQDKYVDTLETRIRSLSNTDSRSRRENLLIMRLTSKEQDINELTNQINELKAPRGGKVGDALLDPVVNLIIQKLKSELEATKTKMTETQEELNAWKFTPDSVTGKRLMSKCRQLLQENEDIGKMIASGRLSKLEAELSMQKTLAIEMKKNQLEMDEFVQELDEDVEGMQSTIYYLQQQLREAKEKLSSYENAKKEEESLEVTNAPVAPPPPPPPPSSLPVENLKNEEIVEKNEEQEEEEEEQQKEEKKPPAEENSEEQEKDLPSTHQTPTTPRRGGRRAVAKTESPRRSVRGVKRDVEEYSEESPKKGRPKRRRNSSKKTVVEQSKNEEQGNDDDNDEDEEEEIEEEKEKGEEEEGEQQQQNKEEEEEKSPKNESAKDNQDDDVNNEKK